MANHAFSAGVAFVLTVMTVAVGQVFKEHLSSSRQGTLFAGGLGSLVFTFALTAISNLKMTTGGNNTKSGLFDVGLALLIAVVASASIHRIAITLCIIFSGIVLFFLNGVSHNRYSLTAVGVTPHGDKKRK